MNRRIGFSIVELLGVISIITLLAALTLPGLARARGRVLTGSCLGNLKQWGLATSLYVLDNDDFLPPDGVPNPGESSTNSGWYVSLPLQLGIPSYHSMSWRTNASEPPGRSVWICPSNRRRSNGRNLFHYCLNQNVNGTGENNQPVRLTGIQSSSTLVWLFDSKNLPAVGSRSFVHTNLHGQGANFLFLDGRAAHYRASEYWDPATSRAFPNTASLSWFP